MTNILIFPYTESAKNLIDFCDQLDIQYFIASSDKHFKTITSLSKKVDFLPLIYESNFSNAFQLYLKSNGIQKIYAPVMSVYTFLKSFIKNNQLDIKLIGHSPIQEQEKLYHDLFEQGTKGHEFIMSIESQNTLTQLDITAVLRQSHLIYGESDKYKILAMMAIFAAAPKGDVIEIGSLMGRTAFVLAFMSQHYNTGPVLTIDPWSASAAVQNDSPELFHKEMPEAWNLELLKNAFVTNLLAINRDKFNYLRLPSIEGYEQYSRSTLVESSEFGKTSYSGKIAVIHIDGNHDFAFVKADCDAWLPHLKDNGWLILDDYVWAHGDGPKKIGDHILKEKSQHIKKAFTCGKALFVQFTHYA